MKRISFVFILLNFILTLTNFGHAYFLSASKLLGSSCPDLSGVFNCTKPDGGSSTISIEQEGHSFKIKGIPAISTLVADGVEHKIPVSGDYKNVSYRATCEIDHIFSKLSGEVYRGMFYLGSAKADIRLSLDSNGNLHRIINGSFRGPFINRPYNESGSCERKK